MNLTRQSVNHQSQLTYALKMSTILVQVKVSTTRYYVDFGLKMMNKVAQMLSIALSQLTDVLL